MLLYMGPFQIWSQTLAFVSMFNICVPCIPFCFIAVVIIILVLSFYKVAKRVQLAAPEMMSCLQPFFLHSGWAWLGNGCRRASHDIAWRISGMVKLQKAWQALPRVTLSTILRQIIFCFSISFLFFAWGQLTLYRLYEQWDGIFTINLQHETFIHCCP